MAPGIHHSISMKQQNNNGRRPGAHDHSQSQTTGRQPGLVQRKAAVQMKPTPAAPPVYRPQPLPKVLQRKSDQAAHIESKNGCAPAVFRSGSPAKAPPVQRRGENRENSTGRGENSTQRGENFTLQRFTSRVVQAVKFYPNLHPGAVEPIDSSNVFRLNSFANQYRLHRLNSHGVNVPNQQYNFVRTREGEMLLHARYRHPSIAEGKQVLYAGEIFFNNGQLQWWSNGSGHYQPYVEDAEQANLPMDQFFSYQQVIKGDHKRKKE